MDFITEVQISTAHRASRDKISGFVLRHPEQFAPLLKMALHTANPNHHKACWNLELVLENKIDWILPHLDEFCNSLEKFTDESALRPISKICQFIAEASESNRAFANQSQLDKIAAAAFDWLISESKVATKAYAMRTLFLLGKQHAWIYPELKEVLQKDFSAHSAGYRAAAKQILQKLNC